MDFIIGTEDIREDDMEEDRLSRHDLQIQYDVIPQTVQLSSEMLHWSPVKINF